MTKVHIIVNAATEKEFSLAVNPGDRVDSIGNVWDCFGAWLRGPDDEQDDIGPTYPDYPLDDPLPEFLMAPASDKTSVDDRLEDTKLDVHALRDAAETDATHNGDLSNYTRNALIDLGWHLIQSSTAGRDFTWTRAPGAHGFYAVEGSPLWFADLKKIQAAAKDDSEVPHMNRIENGPVASKGVIKSYRDALDSIKTDVFTDIRKLSDDEIVRLKALGWEFLPTASSEGEWLKYDEGDFIARQGSVVWLYDILQCKTPTPVTKEVALTPTLELRWLHPTGPAVDRFGRPLFYPTLQQKWKLGGKEEWREVPSVDRLGKRS